MSKPRAYVSRGIGVAVLSFSAVVTLTSALNLPHRPPSPSLEVRRAPRAVPLKHVTRGSPSAATRQQVVSRTPGAEVFLVRPTRSTFFASWHRIAGATRYRIDVFSDNSFSKYVSGYRDLDVGSRNNWTVTGLSPGATYYYRARGYNSVGFVGSSDVRAARTVTGGGLVIIPTFDSSITNHPNAAAIEAMIESAILRHELLFADPAFISIRFRYSTTLPGGEPVDGLAVSEFYPDSIPWNDFTFALRADASTGNDAISISSLPVVVPLSPNVQVKPANGRAIGLSTRTNICEDGTVLDGCPYDGIITLNSAEPFDFNRPPRIGTYDARSATEHEVDEVMGLGSYLNFGGNDLAPTDLFSWSGHNVRNVSSAGIRYFSITSGCANIVDFNQLTCGDFGDFQASPNDTCTHTQCPQAHPYVQNAFGCENQFADVAAMSPEGIDLDVTGYDLIQNSSKLAFGTLVALCDQSGEIFTANSDGSDPQRLTDGEMPFFSPDGSKIVFRRVPDQAEIWIMNVDGTQQERLVGGSSSICLVPSVSAGGCFVTFEGSADPRIQIIDGDGSGQRSLDAVGQYPSISSDGSKVVFNAPFSPDNYSVWAINTDPGSVPMALVTLPACGDCCEAFPLFPSFSADGSKIVFVEVQVNRTPPNCDAPLTLHFWLDVMNSDGSNLHRIWAIPDNNKISYVWFPHFSPDGRTITFSITYCVGGPCRYNFSKSGFAGIPNGTSNSSVYVIDANGSEPILVGAGGASSLGVDKSNSEPEASSLVASINGTTENDGGLLFGYNPNGVQTTFASGLDRPRGVAFDAANNVYVAVNPLDPNSNTFHQGAILKVASDGTGTTFANVNGPSQNFFLQDVKLDTSGNLYVAAGDNDDPNAATTIYKFTTDGTQSVIGSVPGQSFGIALDRAGNVFVADAVDQTIYMFSSSGRLSLFVGPSAFNPHQAPVALAFDGSGNLFVSTESNGQEPDAILKFTQRRVKSTFAAGLNYPRGLAFDTDGNLFVAEIPPTTTGDILKFLPDGSHSVFASGLGNPQGNGGPEFLTVQVAAPTPTPSVTPTPGPSPRPRPTPVPRP